MRSTHRVNEIIVFLSLTFFRELRKFRPTVMNFQRLRCEGTYNTYWGLERVGSQFVPKWCLTPLLLNEKCGQCCPIANLGSFTCITKYATRKYVTAEHVDSKSGHRRIPANGEGRYDMRRCDVYRDSVSLADSSCMHQSFHIQSCAEFPH